MMRDLRYGVWLLMAGGAGACDRCSWRLEYVEADDASGGSSGGVMEASSGADLTFTSSGEASMGSTSAGHSGSETASSGWTTGTSSGGAGTSETGTSGADDIAMPQPVCGDGEIDPGEECDDGNTNDKDACSDDCWAPRTVFVTKSVYNGALDGVQGADSRCISAAKSAGLSGAFKAWISGDEPSSAPALRFGSVGFRGWYVRPDGMRLARGWDGLTGEDGLLASISVTEYGSMASLFDIYAWSNTTSKGLPVGGEHCSLWSSTLTDGGIGGYMWKDSNWSEQGSQLCKYDAHLYCFQIK